MFSTAEKTSKNSSIARKQMGNATFFRKAGEETFFAAKEQGSFFNSGVQAKLTVSQPGDPYEKEADQVAENVMRMPEPATHAAVGSQQDELQLKEEKEPEEVQPKLEAAQINSIQCKGEEEPVQAKLFSNIQRSNDALGSQQEFFADASENTLEISRKGNSIFHSDVVQRSGRGPPKSSQTFENTLNSSNGGGSALPQSTRSFMESRFNADFGGVRIHTGSTAETLSRSIHAQAFTHGNNIYFNSNKYSPDTADGGLLLAHELTHTIQQGASKTNSQSGNISRKPIIQRSSEGSVAPQLSNAVAKAKSQEGKVNANLEGADGYREGWQHLMDYFKTSLGEDKIVNPGQPYAQGAVSSEHIKKKSSIEGMPPAVPRPSSNGPYIRDAMPSWCGIFVFWALNKSGVPMKKWELGGRNVLPEAARTAGSMPQPGDIAYRNEFSHFAIVEKVSGSTVTTVNGNTSGEDNLGAQVQTRDHPLSNWTAFFDPLKLKDGSLTNSEVVPEKPKSLRELRRELFNVNRKEEAGTEKEDELQRKENPANEGSGLSNLSVGSDGKLSSSKGIAQSQEEQVQAKEDDKQEQESKSKLNEHSLQRKAGPDFRNDLPGGHSSPLAKHYSNESTNLLYNGLSTAAYPSIQKQEESGEETRGPPVQLKAADGCIQCSWFDSAVSLVNSAIDYAAEGLEAGKRLILNEARDFAMAIPGYKALRVVLGEDPITGETIERNGHNFIEAAFDIMPGGRLLHQKLTELGALLEAEQWLDRQIITIEALVSGVIGSIERFWNGITLERLASPRQIFEDAGNILYSTIRSIVDFAVTAATELLETVKRFLIEQIVSFIRTQTTAYPLLRVILGRDPVTDESVERNGTTILDALLELGGEEGQEQRKQMRETGTFQKVAGWIDEGIAVFGGAYDEIKAGFLSIWNSVSIDMLMHPIDTFNRIYATFSAPLTRIWNFVRQTAVVILRFIKEVLMRRLSEWARTVRGYHLVTVIIEKDPFTDEVVPRTMENLIRGFMSLMEGGEEQFNQLKESGAIERTTARINAAVARLNMSPAAVVQLFIDLWNSFSLNDLANPVQAFRRILARFGEPIGRLIAFVVEIIRIVIEVILQVMNFPSDLIGNIITKAMLAFDMIKADPVGFLKNLLKAIKQGFTQFFDNILKHLIAGLAGWLMSELKDAGVTAPQDFSLRGIISWVLQLLGITMEKIWEKLAAHPRIGPQRVARIRSMINTLEGIWAFIKDVQERGIAAIWDKIKEQLTNLWDTVLSAVKTWVMEQIVNKMVTKLLSMLDPTGIMAVVNSAIALYSAIQSFIKYLREMLQIVNSFVEGVVEIASGNTKRAADFLESTLARSIPVIIGFLANQVGLSGVGRRIGEMIETVRGLVDQALTWLINKAVDLGGRLLDMGRAAVGRVLTWLGLRKEFTNENGEKHTVSLQGSGANVQLMIESTPTPLLTFINQFAAQPGLSPNKVQAANDARAYVNSDVIPVINQLKAVPEGGDTTALEQQLLSKMVALTEKLRLLAGSTQPLSDHIDKYTLEGAAGTFASMPKPPGDKFTADHIPQNGLFEIAMDLGIFDANSPMAQHAANRTDAGYAMNEEDKRHKAGRTWGTRGSITKASFRTRMNTQLASISGLTEKKNAVVEGIKADKNEDIAEMRAVYGRGLDNDVWKDVRDLPLSQTDKTELQTRIRNQANSGLSLLNSQNLDALKA